MKPFLRAVSLALAIGFGTRPAPAPAQTDLPEQDGGNQAYALAVAPAKHVRASLTVQVEAPKLSAREWVVYAAAMPELTGQTEVRSTLTPDGRPSRESSPEARPVLLARVPVNGPKWRHGLTIGVEYEAVLRARQLVRRRPGGAGADPTVAPLDPKTRRESLARGDEFDVESAGFQQWLKKESLRRESGEGEVDFARRAFLAIKNGFRYRFTTTLDRLASHVCRAGESDCGGLSIVFVAALRGNGIPARTLTGRWALSSDTEPGKEPFHQQHVKAEFFAQGVGWVPADLASAVLYDKSPEGVREFGHDSGDFLTLHLGTALELDTIHFGKEPAEWLQGPVFWATGSGTFDGLKTTENWTVKAEALELREAVLRKPAVPAAKSGTAKKKSMNRARP